MNGRPKAGFGGGNAGLKSIQGFGMVTLLVIVGFVGFINLTSDVVLAGTPKSGSISVDETWDLAGSPYWIEGDLTVETGVNLTIEPGVEVRFNGYFSFFVDGNLRVDSAEITSNQSTPSYMDWLSIQINSGGHLVIENSNLSYSYDAIALLGSNNSVIANNTFTNNHGGITGDPSFSIMTNNTISNENGFGINLATFGFGCRNNTISHNNVSDNGAPGISLYNAIGNILENNTVVGNSWGIQLSSSDNNTVIDNDISLNYVGISVIISSGNNISFNNISYSDLNGVSVSSSVNTNVSHNTFIDDGVYLDGLELQYLNTHTIDDNTVNGKPLYYFKDTSDIDLDGIPVGQLIVANCSNIDGRNLEIDNTDPGVQIYFSTGTDIDNNNITNTGIGIRKISSSKCNITNNEVKDNDYGIHSLYSDENLIEGNKLNSNSLYGIRFWRCSNNTIMDNEVLNNPGNGIYLEFASYDNTVEHNLVSGSDSGIVIDAGYNCSVSYNNVTMNNINGIFIGASFDCDLQFNNVTSNYGIGIDLALCYNSNVIGNNVSLNNGNGINLRISSSDNIIANNDVTENNGTGISLLGSEYNILMENNVSENWGGIMLESYSDYNEVRNNYVSWNRETDSGYGLFFNRSSGNEIIENYIEAGHVLSGATYAIYLQDFSNNNNIMSNDLFGGSFEGATVYMDTSSNNNITYNNITSGYAYTIALNTTSYNRIENNNLTTIEGTSINVSYSGNTRILNNDIMSNYGGGIEIFSSVITNISGNLINSFLLSVNLYNTWNSTITDNTFVSGGGLFIWGDDLLHFNSHNIPDGNTVLGLPIKYYKNSQDLDIDGISLGQLIIANCTNFSMANLQISGLSFMGIEMAYSNNNQIISSNISGHYGFGIILISSSNNIITENYVAGNFNYGLYINGSSDNRIYHNNIFQNINQAFDDSNDNIWNDSYPSGGNYWSDFDEASEGAYDDYQGVDQDVLGSDGIIDNGSGAGGGKNPYIIDSDSMDHYPLLEPIGTLPPLDMTPPEVITDLAAGNPTETTINLTWTAPGDDGGSGIAQGYILKYSTSGPIIEANWSSASTYTQSWVPQSAGSSESQVISGLSSDTRYWFAIKAFDEVPNYGTISNSPDETTLTSSLGVPGAPRNLTGVAGNSYVNLSWDPPVSDGGSSITGYNLYRIGNAGIYMSVPAGQLWFNDTNVTNGIAYEYNVSALNGIGEGPRSLNINAIPMTIPSAPIIPQAVAGDSYVNLTWDPPASDGGSSITGYNIYLNGTLLGSVGPSQLWYNDTGLTNGVTYSYNISAMNAVGEGLRSSISATPRTIPSAPLNLQATAGDSYVNLIWAAPSSNGGSQVFNYAIYRGTSSGEEIFLAEIGTILNYNDTTVTNDVTYYYKVKAKNTVGEGPLSAGASATPKGPEVNVPEDEDQPIWLLWLLILIVIIVLIILLILFKRRKGGEGLPPQEPPQEESLGNESEMPRGQEI